jgi:sec-independent protein translocase protein TatC
MARLRAVKFDEHLTLVEHLDELRTRIIVSVAVLALATGLCFWQNDLLLEIANKPLPDDIDEPITFAVTEPFLTTVTLSIYGGLLLSLPLILYQLYAYVLPAFSPRERRVVTPLLLVIPLLFLAGVVFAYFVVMPAATDFPLNFNDDQFNVQVRARDYYTFFATTLLAVGLIFQVPVGILAATRLGFVTPAQLAQNRRYAILVIAVLAMLMPGQDPITMLLMMAPLIVLFEGSILLASLIDRRAERARAREEAEFEASGDGELLHDHDSDD